MSKEKEYSINNVYRAKLEIDPRLVGYVEFVWRPANPHEPVPLKSYPKRKEFTVVGGQTWRCEGALKVDPESNAEFMSVFPVILPREVREEISKEAFKILYNLPALKERKWEPRDNNSQVTPTFRED